MLELLDLRYSFIRASTRISILGSDLSNIFVFKGKMPKHIDDFESFLSQLERIWKQSTILGIIQAPLLIACKVKMLDDCSQITKARILPIEIRIEIKRT